MTTYDSHPIQFLIDCVIVKKTNLQLKLNLKWNCRYKLECKIVKVTFIIYIYKTADVPHNYDIVLTNV